MALVWMQDYLQHFVPDYGHPSLTIEEANFNITQIINDKDVVPLSDNILKNQNNILNLHELYSTQDRKSKGYIQRFLKNMLDWQIQATEAHKSKDPTALTTYYLLKSRPEVGWGMITPRIPQRAHGVTRGRTLPLSAWGRTSSRSSTQAPRGTGAKRKSESNLASFVAKPSKANQKKTP